MPDVNFRFGRYGQAEITVDGVDYLMQFYPPNLENLEATPERMIAEMEIAGVDIGVLQSDHVYGANINEYYVEAMRRYPGPLHRAGADPRDRGRPARRAGAARAGRD